MAVITFSNIFNSIESLSNYWISIKQMQHILCWYIKLTWYFQVSLRKYIYKKKKSWRTIQYQGHNMSGKTLPRYTLAKFELMDTAVLRYLPSLIIFTKGIPIKRRNSKNFILIKIETIVLLVCLFALLLADMLACLLPY